MSAARPTMAFKNEVVSDADIDRYHLPFPKGGGRWWTRDAERDYYLWGGISGNPAYDDEREGRFFLYVHGVAYRIVILPGESPVAKNQHPYIVKWKSILEISPTPKNSFEKNMLIGVLTDALIAYGFDGEDDNWIEDVRVVIQF